MRHWRRPPTPPDPLTRDIISRKALKKETFYKSLSEYGLMDLERETLSSTKGTSNNSFDNIPVHELK